MSRILIITCDTDNCDCGYNIQVEGEVIPDLSLCLPPGWSCVRKNNSIERLGFTSSNFYCRVCTESLFVRKELDLSDLITKN